MIETAKGFVKPEQNDVTDKLRISISENADKADALITALETAGSGTSANLTALTSRVGAVETGKADKATTLAGYGITDGVTKEEVGALIPDNVVLADVASGEIVPIPREADTLGGKDRGYFENVASAFTGSCSFSGGVFTIVIDGGVVPAKNLFEVKFKAPAVFTAGNTFSFGGKSYPVKTTDGKAAKTGLFASGAAVSCVVDQAGSVVNFKAGSGYGTLPGQSGITLQNVSGGVKITITRPNVENYAGTLVVRKVGSYPAFPEDGVQIDVDVATTYTDTNVADGTTYFYRTFAYNADKEYQTLVQGAQANIKYVNGISLSTLPVGALVKTLVKLAHQSLLGEYLVFKIADKNHVGYPTNAITLITDRIISMRCFDAKEPSNSDSNRRSYGNNRYTVSNIDQWLNSIATAGAWYSAQHSADAPPNVSGVSSNAYDTQAGFLAMLDNNFVSALIQTTVTVANNTVTDGGGYETKASKMFLASTTEVGLSNENGIAEGSKLALFSNDTSRIAYCTQQAITNSNDNTKPANTSALWYWLFRTPSSGSSHNVRSASTSGALYNYNAYNGAFGVRPLCNLPSDISVSLTPDSDGAYIIF